MLDKAIEQGTKIWDLSKENLSSSDDKSAKEIAAVSAALDMAEMMTTTKEIPASFGHLRFLL